jgi:two-component system response regulator HupR/HoxA
VIQDCGALPENLLESELFGHVKGAFTGASGDHPGLFRLAEGGTIFLDEIENTTPNLQAKLLRVLETGTVRPVGGTQVRHVDARVVVASNRDLRVEVAEGRFRADLFYRLNTFIIDIPPLRARHEDILPLARHFLAQANLALGCRATGLSPEAEVLLLGHAWPGNVRELRNVLERAVLLSRPGEAITPDLLPPDLVPGEEAPSRAGSTLRDRVAATERAAIQDALARHGGVLRRAARELGVSPVTLGRKVRQLGLDPKQS